MFVEELNAIDIKLSKRQNARDAVNRLRECKVAMKSYSGLVAEIIKPQPDIDKCQGFLGKATAEDWDLPTPLYVKAELHRHQGLLYLKVCIIITHLN